MCYTHIYINCYFIHGITRKTLRKISGHNFVAFAEDNYRPLQIGLLMFSLSPANIPAILFLILPWRSAAGFLRSEIRTIRWYECSSTEQMHPECKQVQQEWHREREREREREEGGGEGRSIKKDVGQSRRSECGFFSMETVIWKNGKAWAKIIITVVVPLSLQPCLPAFARSSSNCVLSEINYNIEISGIKTFRKLYTGTDCFDVFLTEKENNSVSKTLLDM